MLAALRNIAKSLFFKVFLGVLVLSFAIWGVGNVFTGGGVNRVATVGDLEVDAIELDRDFRNALQQLQQQTQQPITRADAIRFGMLDQSLQRLIARRMLDAEAAAIGLSTSDEAVARMIREQTAFQVDGRFDRERFQALLRQNGLDESAFAEDLRAERSRDALAGAIRPVGGLPEAVLAPLAARLAETRTGELLVVPSARFSDIDADDDGVLEAFLEANAGRFQAPERRSLTAALLDAELLVDELIIDENTLRARYEAQIDTYRTPERRSVRQLRGSEQADLQAAYDALRSGETVDAVARRLDGVALSALGEVQAAVLPADFAAPIFAAAGAGDVTPPTESAFGWHVFVIDDVIPAAVQPFAQVREELRRQVARQQAAEQLPDLAVALDDALGAGDSLDQAATALGLPVTELVAIDRFGGTTDGTPVPALEAWETLLVEAFAAAEGETSLLEETADGRFFVFRIDEVQPARTLTLAEAREQVATAWRTETALERAEAAAAAALADIQGGMSLDEASSVHALEPRPIEAQSRTEPQSPAPVHEALFATAPGSVGDAVVPLADGAAILRVDGATGLDASVATATREEIAAGLTRDLLVQFELALRREHPVRIDRARLERLFAPEGQL